MTEMGKKLQVRRATQTDQPFMFELSPILANVAKLSWHELDTIQTMQRKYITEMLANTSVPNETFIAQQNNQPIGFIHVRAHNDGVSGETCATVPLLAVSAENQGTGVGTVLIETAEKWAKGLGYRLMHLEVFASNKSAISFYSQTGFQPEILHMVKEL